MEFSHVCEMKITFIVHPRFMTYEQYVEQPKQMVEWLLYRKIYTNPEPIKTLRNMAFPLLTKYEFFIENRDEMIYNMFSYEVYPRISTFKVF